MTLSWDCLVSPQPLLGFRSESRQGPQDAPSHLYPVHPTSKTSQIRSCTSRLRSKYFEMAPPTDSDTVMTASPVPGPPSAAQQKVKEHQETNEKNRIPKRRFFELDDVRYFLMELKRGIREGTDQHIGLSVLETEGHNGIPAARRTQREGTR
jgi:hypothetical protein